MTSLTNSDDMYSIGLCPLRCGEGELGIVGVSVGEQHDNVLYAFSVTASAREASLARKAEQAKYQVHNICGGDVLGAVQSTTVQSTMHEYDVRRYDGSRHGVQVWERRAMHKYDILHTQNIHIV